MLLVLALNDNIQAIAFHQSSIKYILKVADEAIFGVINENMDTFRFHSVILSEWKWKVHSVGSSDTVIVHSKHDLQHYLGELSFGDEIVDAGVSPTMGAWKSSEKRSVNWPNIMLNINLSFLGICSRRI